MLNSNTCNPFLGCKQRINIKYRGGSTGKGPTMGQIEQTVCKQMTEVKLSLLYSNSWNYSTVYKKELTVVLEYYL